jgi:hypothetical protein
VDYRVTDSHVSPLQAPGILRITVHGVNDAPTIAALNSTVGVYEGDNASNSGRIIDPDSIASSLTASVGVVTNNGDVIDDAIDDLIQSAKQEEQAFWELNAAVWQYGLRYDEKRGQYGTWYWPVGLAS